MGPGFPALRLTAWTVAIVLGGLQVVAHPYRLSSDDAISYLDLADAYLRHDWKSVLNGYWSPLYPVLNAALIAIFWFKAGMIQTLLACSAAGIILYFAGVIG